MEYVNLDRTKAFQELKGMEKKSVKELLSKERIGKCNIKLGGGLTYNYASMPVSDDIVAKLNDLAREMDLIGKYKRILSGERMNTGENRLVLHHLTRGNVLGEKVEADGEDKEAFYKGELEKIRQFSGTLYTNDE